MAPLLALALAPLTHRLPGVPHSIDLGVASMLDAADTAVPSWDL